MIQWQYFETWGCVVKSCLPNLTKCTTIVFAERLWMQCTMWSVSWLTINLGQAQKTWTEEMTRNQSLVMSKSQFSLMLRYMEMHTHSKSQGEWHCCVELVFFPFLRYLVYATMSKGKNQNGLCHGLWCTLGWSTTMQGHELIQNTRFIQDKLKSLRRKPEHTHTHQLLYQ